MTRYLTLTILLLAFAVYSQEDIRNFRTARIYAGLPFQSGGESQEWYTPDYEIGFDLHHSIRLSKQFFLSAGLGMKYGQFRTDPFIRSWTSYNYSPSIGVYNVQFHKDDYAREVLGRYAHVRFPLQLEYIPSGKWKPYAKAGFVFDSEVFAESKDVYANTNEAVPENSWTYSENVDGDEALISGLISGGVKHQYKDIELMLGISGQVGLFAFDKKIEAERFAVGVEFGIRKGIRTGIFPNKKGAPIDSTHRENSRYVYAELLGAGGLFSLNFERCLIQGESFRFNQRIGLGVYSFDDRLFNMPIGFNMVLGRKVGFETGVDVVPIIGDLDESMIIPHVGVRMEFGQLFLRASVGSWIRFRYPNYDIFLPGLSIGKRF